MHLIERNALDHPAATVWPLVVSPEMFSLWNDKIISMDAGERFTLGQTFTTRYLMTGKELSCRTTVTALEEGRLLELSHSDCVGPRIRTNLAIRERITLTESAGRTAVLKEIDIENHGIPWYFAALFWYVNRFGKPAGPDKLKQLCDASA